LQCSGLAGPLALDTKRRPWHGIKTTAVNVPTAICAYAERPLLNSAKSQCNRTHDARLVIQTYNREVPVESVLLFFKAIGASYDGDAIQTLPGTS
jgi:hypothetical protein